MRREHPSQEVTALTSRPTVPIRWGIVLGLGIAFTVALNFWVLHAELSSGGANIAGGNPPVPVLLALAVLLLLRRLLRLTEAEIVGFYLFAVTAFLPTTLGGVRAFFPCLTTPLYYAAPDNRLKEFWQLLPNWWMPRDAVILRGFFEGAEGLVPWSEWLPPLARWTFFFVSLWSIGWGIAWWLAPNWLRAERLNFPLAQLPCQMIQGIDGQPFFASRLVWFGMIVGMLPTGVMACRSLFQPIERFWDLGAYFVDRPFNLLRPLLIYPLVEGIGFGYFVPQDALLSVWFSYAMLKLFSLVGIGMLGWDVPDFPFPSAQSFGGYLAVAMLLVVRGWRQRTERYQRFPLLALLIGWIFVLSWMLLSGMSLPIALLYTGILTGFTVTYTRVRAELGMPYTNVHPYGAQREFWQLFGIPNLLRLGGKRSLVVLVGLFWLVRRFLLFQNGAYGADALKLANEIGLPMGKVWVMGLTAVLVGLWAAFVSHLCAYYRWGANFLEGAPGTGDYRTYEAAQDYRVLGWMMDAMQPANRWHIGFALYGAAIIGILARLRRSFPNFPLHPLGFVLGSAFGHHCPYWFPTLLIWAIKGVILHYGGLQGHRRLIPFFLGLTLGHYLMTGVLWAGIIYPLVRGRWGYPLRILFQ